MKVKPEHFAHMKTAITAFVNDYGADKLAEYKARLSTDARVHDVDKRYRWELFNGARLTQFACDTLYSYCNDEHIDTALRKIVA